MKVLLKRLHWNGLTIRFLTQTKKINYVACLLVRLLSEIGLIFLVVIGYITGSQWSSAVESVLKLDVPWNMLRHQLAHVLPDGRVDYLSCLDQYVIETGLQKARNSLLELRYFSIKPPGRFLKSEIRSLSPHPFSRSA